MAVQYTVMMAMNFLSTHNLEVGEMMITLPLVTLQPFFVPFQEISFLSQLFFFYIYIYIYIPAVGMKNRQA